jgi:ribosomal-protein-alanine N-acetyltransferase
LLAADAERLMPIESVSFGQYHWSPDAFRNELNNHMAHYWLLEDTETALVWGYMGCWDILGEGHITTIAIHPKARGLGWGEVLLAHLLAHLHLAKVESITLEVRTSNFSAQNLYYKYGFKQVGRRPRYYQDTKEDALLLTYTVREAHDTEQEFQRLVAQLWKRCSQHWPNGHLIRFVDTADEVNTPHDTHPPHHTDPLHGEQH